MDVLLRDIRFAVRMLARSPGFAAAAIITLGLGIGANTTMFSIVNGVLLRPLPFPEPDRLMTIWNGRADEPRALNIVSLPDYREWRARSQVFEELALFDSAGRGYNLTGGTEPEQVSGVRVTASFFRVLGIAPLLGRTFLEEEEEPARDNVVVLSHGLWQRRFGGDPAIVGRAIPIDGQDHVVVGVMPERFRFQFWSGPRELWVPAGWTAGDRERGSNSFVCIGRLARGVTPAQASSEAEAVSRALVRERPADYDAQWTTRIVPMAEYGVRQLRPALLALLGVVGFVLLISCVNVANLSLARATARQREVAIRSALGAGRARIVRQLLTESVLLALMGGAVGLVIAWWGATVLPAVLPGGLTRIPLRPLERIALDGSVLAFTAGAAVLTGVLFGLAPALASFRGDLGAPLKENARGSTPGGKSRLRYGLVASEVALTLVVVVGAGLMIASVARLLGVDPGLDPRNVLMMSLSLPQEDLYYGPPGNPRFCQALDEQVGAVPGVLSVSLIAHPPLAGGGAGRRFTIEGRPAPAPGQEPGAGYSVACPNVMRTLGVPLASGREFTLADTLGAPPVALINESMARRFWPDEDAVGKRFKLGGLESSNPWLTVVGVSRDVRHFGLDEDLRPSFLRPYAQAGWPFATVIVKTATEPLPLAARVKEALARAEPGRPVARMTTMEATVASSVSGRRFPMLLLTTFAALALALAAVGIAGVVGYSVAQRTQEIGVRMALGAQARDVLRMMIGQSLAWTAGGLVVGLLASALVLRFLASLLYGVRPLDPLVVGGAALLLAAVAAAASYLPARRAARVDPVAVLRT
jgi:putative ABC transport system permease protein